MKGMYNLLGATCSHAFGIPETKMFLTDFTSSTIQRRGIGSKPEQNMKMLFSECFTGAFKVRVKVDKGTCPPKLRITIFTSSPIPSSFLTWNVIKNMTM